MKLQAQAQAKLRELVEIGALPASQCGHRAGQLPTQRFRKLDALGVEFEEPKSRRQTKAQRILPQKWIEWSERRWNLQFSKLEAFKKQFGHCNVSKYKGADNGLADWVLNQRKFARSGKLTSERRKRLNRIGFLWRGHNPQYDNRDKRYAKLVAYKKKFGHCDVPCHWKEDRGFGHWVSNQRSFRNKGLLSKGRIARLDKIGFSCSVLPRLEDPPEAFRKWANAQDEAWAFHFARLLAYKKEHGSCNVRQQDGSNGRLHGWVQKQKEIARSGRMRGNGIAVWRNSAWHGRGEIVCANFGRHATPNWLRSRRNTAIAMWFAYGKRIPPWAVGSAISGFFGKRESCPTSGLRG